MIRPGGMLSRLRKHVESHGAHYHFRMSTLRDDMPPVRLNNSAEGLCPSWFEVIAAEVVGDRVVPPRVTFLSTREGVVGADDERQGVIFLGAALGVVARWEIERVFVEL